MGESQICRSGAPFSLKNSNFRESYCEIMNSLIEPSQTKKEFAKTTNSTKLEVVFIELRSQLDPIYRANLYNIAHIYGGGDVAFSIVCHIDAASQVKEILGDEWRNVRIIPVAKTGQKMKIENYNMLLTNLEFWSLFRSRFILITHIDSVLFRPLDDWMYDYDLIGAPWSLVQSGKPNVGNGGYTLRNVTCMQDTLQKFNYSAEYPDYSYPEDMWWQEKLDNLPSELKALEFAAENYVAENFIPTGAHQLSLKWRSMVKLSKAFRLLQQYGCCI